MAEKETDIVKLTEELQSKTDWCAQLQEEKVEIERERNLFEKTITELQTELKYLQGKVASNEASSKIFSGLPLQLSNVERARQNLQEEHQASSLECTQLRQKVSDLEVEVQANRAGKNNFQTRTQILAKEKKKLEHESQKKDEEIALLKQKCEDTETQLTLKLPEVKDERDQAQRELDNLRRTSEKMQEDFQVQATTLGDLRLQHGDLQDLHRKLEEERSNYEKVQVFEDLQKQFDELKQDRLTLELKLQKAQSDLKNEQKNCELEKDTTKHLRTEIAQLNHSLSSQEREVQAMKDKGRHRREVMQQTVKLLKAQVAAVRYDLDQERSRQSDLKDSVELLLNPQSGVVRFLKTELVSRAAELRKCRDELKTTMAERDRLRHTIAKKQYMDQHFDRLKEEIRNLVQMVSKVLAGVGEVSTGVSELDKGVQQLQDQTSSTSSVQQSLTAPAPVSKNLTEDETRPQEMSCCSEPQTGAPDALVKYQPGDAEGASVQCSSPGFAMMKFWQGLERDSQATTGQTSRTPSQESVDPSLLQQALTLPKLMDYLPDLADKGLRIAGRLNMQKQWDSLASSHPELCDRLQKLFAMWLEGEEDSKTPHTWGFFISLVQEKGIDQHKLAKKICSNLNASAAPNSASLSSSSGSVPAMALY